MSTACMPPPANPQCQLYYHADPQNTASVERCPERGTHWVRWPSCECIDENGDDTDCVDDFYSWECDKHDQPVKEAS